MGAIFFPVAAALVFRTSARWGLDWVNGNAPRLRLDWPAGEKSCAEMGAEGEGQAGESRGSSAGGEGKKGKNAQRNRGHAFLNITSQAN